MTDRERAEAALLKVGYVLFHATEEYVDYDRKDEHCTSHVRVNRKTGHCRINDLIVPADRLMAHLFPVLAEEERKALKWGMELMGDCQGADALRSILSRFGGGQA